MPAAGHELLALALSLQVEETDAEAVVDALLESAEHSPTALMGAYAYALCLARDMPYDPGSEHTLGLLTKALHRAVRHAGALRGGEGTNLLEHIVAVSGSAPLAPGAVASRSGELQADVERLRHSAEP